MDVIAYLRSCHFCGSTWGHCEWVCAHCLELLGEKASEKHYVPAQYPFQMHSLFSWNKGEDRTWKSELLLNLKGGGKPTTLAFIARNLALRTRVENFARVCWVPAPPRQEGEKDHAYRLAECLQSLLGGELAAPLARASTDEQKKKSLEERERSKMKLVAEPPRRSQKTIFVDDLIASGSTVIAAYQALREPSEFEAWALAHRPKLAENRGG